VFVVEEEVLTNDVSKTRQLPGEEGPSGGAIKRRQDGAFKKFTWSPGKKWGGQRIGLLGTASKCYSWGEFLGHVHVEK